MPGTPGFGVAEHAVLIGIDGIMPSTLQDAISRGTTPNLAGLKDRGAWSYDVRVTQPSSSLSSWASILTGAPPAWHGVHHAAQFGRPPAYPVRPAGYPEGVIWPTLFTAAREARPAITTAAYYSWPPLGGLLAGDLLNASVLRTCGSCDACKDVEPEMASEFARALKRERYGLSWIYFDVLDECAHRMGNRDEARYLPLIQQVDGLVGRITRALHAAKMARSTLIFVLSDHGREAPTGKRHGGFSTAEMAVPWILAGPGVRPGTQLAWPIASTDAAPTLLHALGIRPPVQMHGRVVAEAFEGGGADTWRVRALTLRAASPERRLDASQRLVGALLSPGAVCAFFLSCLVGVGCRALHRSASSDFAPG